MKKVMVGGVPTADAAGMMNDFFSKIGKSISWEEFAAFLRRQNPFDHEGWIEEIVFAEKAVHLAFFGKATASGFDYSKFEAVLRRYGQAKMQEWAALGLQVAFLPPVEMRRDASFPGWRVKPEKWFYEKAAEGKVWKRQPGGEFALDNKPLWLGDPAGGTIILFDTRCKPNYNEGKQMWPDDEFLSPIMGGLRKEGKVVKYEYGPQSSRFGISAEEIEQSVWPAVASLLGLKPEQVRSERVVEFNYLSQAYPVPRSKDDGETNTSIWFAEGFEGGQDRFCGGLSVYGGLAHVGYFWAGYRWDGRSCRPLAAL